MNIEAAIRDMQGKLDAILERLPEPQPKLGTCPDCAGSGKAPVDRGGKCGCCGGKGRVYFA